MLRMCNCATIVATVLLIAAVVTVECLAGPPVGPEKHQVRAAAPAELHEIQRAFQSIIARVSRSTVTIRANRVVAQSVSFADGREARTKTAVVNGSGVVLSECGAILTNEHVIQGASELRIVDCDGNQFEARVIAADARSDMAVLQAGPGHWQPAEFAGPERLVRGQWVIVVGNPYGLANDGRGCASVGVIANLGRRLPGLGEADDRLYHHMIQFTASIHPGNSGGPLFDLDGRLIGIVTAMHTRAPADEGIGFAIPLTPVRQRIIDTLRRGEQIAYGYLGLSIRSIPAPHGGRDSVVIDAVESHGPASDAGLRAGDVIVRYNGQPVTDCGQFAELVGESMAGGMVSVEVLRGGRQKMFAVRVAQRQFWRVACFQGDALLWRGARICEWVPRLKIELTRDGLRAGVVVADVAAASPAAAAGLRPGDVVTRVDNDEITSLDAFERRVGQRNTTIELTLLDRGSVRIEP